MSTNGDTMKKVLIAVNSEIVSEDLRERLHGHFDILCCHDGTEALAVLNDVRPDLLVIDLMLADLDGITVLNTALAAGITPRVVALTDYVSTFMADALEQLDVCSVFRYGSDMRVVAARVIEVSEDSSQCRSVQSQIRYLIAVLGFNMNTFGTHMTEVAVLLYKQNPTQSITRDLYPAVARACNGTATQVERGIRFSIEKAWLSRNEEIWRLYFSVGKNGKVSRPTNANFLARIAGCIENISNVFEQEDRHREKIG